MANSIEIYSNFASLSTLILILWSEQHFNQKKQRVSDRKPKSTYIVKDFKWRKENYLHMKAEVVTEIRRLLEFFHHSMHSNEQLFENPNSFK